ncbi:polyhydroxyalkanoate synthesis regulator DNA-binding domain-containing protein [Anaerolinea sp.]|uniref:polyhydroxyalkanoate synthesis regulator DNA-binding domain-containing protein n=1 Tax=Anaerolinea sp. TaxID=1872519 RepID=UPI002ACEF2AA|nr:polyhydroxyalkanoate synthesis regulator DNA-binding domain-containing protein [Anaerolinea sp.]
MSLIKRYHNRKLYDTASRSYVTLEQIARMVRDGEDVRVVDHESGSDITSLVFMQILLEEQKRVGELFPQVVLLRLLRSGEDTLDALRERLLAAFDPQGFLHHAVRRRIRQGVEQGEISPPEAEKFLRMWFGESPLEESPAELSSSSGKDTLEQLQAQLRALEDELQRLQSSLQTSQTFTAERQSPGESRSKSGGY